MLIKRISIAVYLISAIVLIASIFLIFYIIQTGDPFSIILLIIGLTSIYFWLKLGNWIRTRDEEGLW